MIMTMLSTYLYDLSIYLLVTDGDIVLVVGVVVFVVTVYVVVTVTGQENA